MEKVVEYANVIRNFIGIPADISIWDLMNSELIVALAALIVGSVLNRRLGGLQEKTDDDRLARELEAELHETDLSPSFESVSSESRSTVVARKRAPTSDTAPEPSPESRAPPNVMFSRDVQNEFDRGADIISDIKAMVDERIASLRDGRKKRKYKNIGKRDYRLRVLALHNDEALNSDLVALLLRVFELWRPYQRNVKDIPEGLVEELGQLEHQVRTQFMLLGN